MAARSRARALTLVLAATAFRLWFAQALPLSGDEAYHWQWSQHLAFGYYDHPPLTAWLISLSSDVLRVPGELGVRLPAIACFSAAALLARALARRITLDAGGTPDDAERAGLAAVVLVVLAPLPAFLAVYMHTDPPLVLAGMVFLATLHRAGHSNRLGPWIGAGAAFGLALLCKLLALLLLPAGLSLFRARRPAAPGRSRRALAAALAALVVAGPFLAWSATHGWAAFRFNFGLRQHGQEASVFHLPRYVLEQALAVSPGVFLLVLAGLRDALSARTVSDVRGARMLGLAALVPLAVFLPVSLFRQVGIHWPLCGWIAGMVWAAACIGLRRPWVERLFPPRRLALAFAFCAGPTLLLHLAGIAAPRLAATRIGKPLLEVQAFQELYGWKELAAAAARARRELASDACGRPGSPHGAFVAADQYGLDSLVAFYSPDRLETHLWVPRKRHGESYRDWDDWESLAGQCAVFVTKKDVAERLPALRARFARVEEPVELTIEVAGTRVRSFHLVRCHRFDGTEPFGAER